MPTINYRKKDGTPVSGVTTVMSAVLAKPALVPWAFSQGMENLERLSREILKKSSEENTGLDDIIAVVREFKPSALYEKRDSAASAGTLGHALVEHDLKGLPEPDMTNVLPDTKARAEGCYLAFLEWKERTKFKLIHSEIPLVSEKHGFGGCLDIGGGVDKLELIDLKTGKGIYSNMFVQLGGYAILWDETHPENLMTGYNILNIHPDGSFTHQRKTSIDAEKEIFLYCVKIFHTMKKAGIKL